MPPVSSYHIEDGVAVLHLDDGKANAVGYDTLAAINAAVHDAQRNAKVLVVAGREGRFSAGFDLRVIGEGPEAARELVTAGAHTAMKVYGSQVPVVAACTGHALAYGAILLLASDLRLGADVSAKIGLNEVSIGMPLPIFAVELARQRLSRRHFTAATALATVYSPRDAVGAGYLDDVLAPDVLYEAAIDRAAMLAGYLRSSGFVATRRNARGATIKHILATLDQDLASFGVSD